MSESIGVQVGRVCPRCGKEDSVPLIWGMPGPEDWRLAERRQVSFGGCVVLADAPDFSCRACGLEWGHEADPTTDEQELADLLAVRHADVVRALGRGWRRDTGGRVQDGTQWFVSGQPAQVAIGVMGGSFVLDRPREDGPPVFIEDQRRFQREDLLFGADFVAETADAIASGRRRSFRWCRCCRRGQAPEWFVGADRVCRDCETVLAELDL